MPKRERSKRIGVERRLLNLGLLEIEVRRIPGYQRTVYNLTKKGIAVRDQLSRAHRALKLAQQIRGLAHGAGKL